MSLIFTKTADNTLTLYSTTYNDFYHSLSGSLLETKHIYIHHCLEVLLQNKNTLRILDVGFGTGLNAICTYAKIIAHSASVAYYAIEPFPLDEHILMKLEYFKHPELQHYAEAYWRMHHHKSSIPLHVSHNFWFSFLYDTIQDLWLPEQFFDGIYFDLFKPDSMPHCWSEHVLTKLYHSMKKGGILVTYSCKGWVRRNFINAGFHIQKIKGIGQKKEFTFARRL